MVIMGLVTTMGQQWSHGGGIGDNNIPCADMHQEELYSSHRYEYTYGGGIGGNNIPCADMHHEELYSLHRYGHGCG